MKKELMSKFIVLILFLSFFNVFGVVIAQNDPGEIDKETEKEVEIMEEPLGAKLRILQLKRQILIKIINAQEVIDYLKENGSNASNLEIILEELNLLVGEVDGILENSNDLTPEKFVDIKTDAKSLVKEFRENAGELLSDEDKDNLRVRLESLTKERILDINEEIRIIRRDLIKKKVQRILLSAGISDGEILELIESEEITADEVKARLRNHYDSLTEEKKKRAVSDLREDEIETKRESLKKIHIIAEERTDRATDRIEKRRDILEERGFNITDKRLRKVEFAADANIQNKRINESNSTDLNIDRSPVEDSQEETLDNSVTNNNQIGDGA